MNLGFGYQKSNWIFAVLQFVADKFNKHGGFLSAVLFNFGKIKTVTLFISSGAILFTISQWNADQADAINIATIKYGVQSLENNSNI